MKHIIRIPWLVYGSAVILIVLVLVQSVLAAGGINPINKWAWGTSVGWINFSPGYGGVNVYPDHLEGFAWGENIGWIRMGTYTGGGSHVYANTSATDYGVNRITGGVLKGYAWGTNAGWIKFDPLFGGVKIDPETGVFSGFAWGENIGWIKVSGTGYSVVSEFRDYRTYLPVVVR